MTNGEFYPSFRLILASITFLIGKWKLAKNNFHKIIGNFSKLWGKIIPHSFESCKTWGKDQFPIVLNCKLVYSNSTKKRKSESEVQNFRHLWSSNQDKLSNNSFVKKQFRFFDKPIIGQFKKTIWIFDWELVAPCYELQNIEYVAIKF